MKKTILALALSTLTFTTATACPLWECQYDIDDYNCNHYQHNEYSTERQPIYCQYCGHEAWDCICGSNYDCNDGYVEETACPSSYGYEMGHWANVRDECGNIIGQVGEGSCVEVVGIDCNDSDRVMIYDYSTGCYGSVLASCVTGDYQWDGTAGNGRYDSYQGGGYEAADCGYSDCGYYGPADCGGGNGYAACTAPYSVSYYRETVVREFMQYIGGRCW